MAEGGVVGKVGVLRLLGGTSIAGSDRMRVGMPCME
jgi:hypothetical protein